MSGLVRIGTRVLAVEMNDERPLALQVLDGGKRRVGIVRRRWGDRVDGAGCGPGVDTEAEWGEGGLAGGLTGRLTDGLTARVHFDQMMASMPVRRPLVKPGMRGGCGQRGGSGGRCERGEEDPAEEGDSADGAHHMAAIGGPAVRLEFG